MTSQDVLTMLGQALLHSQDPRIVSVATPGEGELALTTTDGGDRQRWILFDDDVLETDPAPAEDGPSAPLAHPEVRG
jgi:hypothetical protein